METFASIMEMMMVVCFGISWPLNIVKAWNARTAKGTSLLFYSFLWIGYVFAPKCSFTADPFSPAERWGRS